MRRKLIGLFCFFLVLGLAQANAADTAPLRWKIDPGKPMHVQGCNVLRDLVAGWRGIPADIRPISVLELDNYDNYAETEAFEDCFIECQKHGIPVMPEVVRYGAKNDTINVAWLDSMFKKYSTIVAIVFDCNEPGQLKTHMMREYLEVCGRNGAYFFFNMENKALTLPEDLDMILADRELVATMKKYHKNIVVSYYGGGMRGVPTDAQKAKNLEKVQKMLADGLIGRLGCYHCQSRGADVDRERANGCTAFGGNEFQEARNADYWKSLRNVMRESKTGRS